MTTPGSILDDQTHTSSGEKQQDVSVADARVKRQNVCPESLIFML